ncbi:hypothetical protein [Synechococcus sp. A15-24]|nr:hypothetical protein [Synechococcus sp. A15-24]QNJ28750.1 hypothetical protein SynA1524_01047 [Synechococcus sp. A15-24]
MSGSSGQKPQRWSAGFAERDWLTKWRVALGSDRLHKLPATQGSIDITPE